LILLYDGRWRPENLFANQFYLSMLAVSGDYRERLPVLQEVD
jgi:hypothetical protein